MTTTEEFRKFGKEMIDYVADYMENIRDRRVIADVQPGYIRPLIPEEAPENPESWQDVMKDLERVIMPGITHWHHPNFHAYFITANSYPAIVADILSAGIGSIGFSWMASPAYTELEMVMMDWLGKLLNLPEHFLFSSNSTGGGSIQSTASDASYACLLTARSRHIGKNLENIDNMSKLIVYASRQTHSLAEKNASLAGVKIRFLDTDENYALRGETLVQAIKEDKSRGLIPIYIIATLGTTTSCAFDNLKELGPICKEENIWLHIDGAYAGSAFICEEYRYLMEGIEYADSFNVTLAKWMLVNFDCSALWVKNVQEYSHAFNVDPVYLRHEQEGRIPDYRHWQIPLGRRFRSLKVWFVLRLYGKTGIQKHIRKNIELAHEFEEIIKKDDRFEICAPVIMGLVCFRLKASNEINELLNKNINDESKIHITPSKLNDKFILRLALTDNYPVSQQGSKELKFAYNNIVAHAEKILSSL